MKEFWIIIRKELEWEAPKKNFQFNSRNQTYSTSGPKEIPKEATALEIFSKFFSEVQTFLLAEELTRIAKPKLRSDLLFGLWNF